MTELQQVAHQISSAARQLMDAAEKMAGTNIPPHPEQPEKAPDGYEFTGERRTPRRGEWFLLGSGAVGRTTVDVGDPRWILRKLPTIEYVYGNPFEQLKAPEGWEFTGEFRVPGPKDAALGIVTGSLLGGFMAVGLDRENPRLILRRKPAPKRWVFEETGEVRMAKHGEWYANQSGSIVKCSAERTIDAHPILRLAEKPDAQ